MKISTLTITRAAVTAALYAVLTVCFAPISYGFIQFRVSECLCILPLFFGDAVLGLTVGCFIANLFGNGILDMIFGTLATFFASVLTYFIGRIIRNSAVKLLIGGLPPVILNAVVVPFTILVASQFSELYFLYAAYVAAGECGVIYTLGTLLYVLILRNKGSILFEKRK